LFGFGGPSAGVTVVAELTFVVLAWRWFTIKNGKHAPKRRASPRHVGEVKAFIDGGVRTGQT
jgi:hypothetical protein